MPDVEGEECEEGDESRDESRQGGERLSGLPRTQLWGKSSAVVVATGGARGSTAKE